jgi:hypothetical protein
MVSEKENIDWNFLNQRYPHNIAGHSTALFIEVLQMRAVICNSVDHYWKIQHKYRYITFKLHLEQIMRAQRGSRVIAILFFELRSYTGVGGQRHAPANLPPEITRCPLYRRLGGPQCRPGRWRKISPPTCFEPRTVQPVANRYTDCSILAQLPLYLFLHGTGRENLMQVWK